MYTSIKDTVSLIHLNLTTTAFHFIMLFAVNSMPIFSGLCTKSEWKQPNVSWVELCKSSGLDSVTYNKRSVVD